MTVHILIIILLFYIILLYACFLAFVTLGSASAYTMVNSNRPAGISPGTIKMETNDEIQAQNTWIPKHMRMNICKLFYILMLIISLSIY